MPHLFPRLAAVAAVLLLAPTALADPPPAPRKARPAQRSADGRAVVASPAFWRLQDGVTRISVEIGAKIKIAQTPGEGRLVFRLREAQVLGGSGQPVYTTYAGTPVVRATLVQDGRDVELVIELRQAAPASFRVVDTPGGMELVVEFPPVAEPPRPPPPRRPPPPPRPESAERPAEPPPSPDTPAALDVPPDIAPSDEPREAPREKSGRRPGRDHARVRGGVALEGGALIVPGVATPVGFGLQTQLGVQINHSFAVTSFQALDFIVGSLHGFNVTAALLADWTWNDTLSVGAGPDFGYFVALGQTSAGIGVGGGVLYGGRIHFAWYPVLGWGQDGVRRKALSIAADVRLLGGGAAFGTSQSGSTGSFAVSPMLSVGYQAF